QVFLELDTLALEIAVELAQLALATDAVGVRHDGCVLVVLLGLRAQTVGQLLELGFTLLEFGVDLGDCSLGRRGVTNDAFDADKTGSGALLCLRVRTTHRTDRAKRAHAQYRAASPAPDSVATRNDRNRGVRRKNH